MSGGGEHTQAAALMSVLVLEEREPDLFVGKTPGTTMQRIFGGQVAGQALMAAASTTRRATITPSRTRYVAVTVG